MAMPSASGQLCWMFFLKIVDDQDQELELLKDGYRSPIPDRLQWRNWAADPEGITGEALLSFVNDDLFASLKEIPSAAGPRGRVVRDVFEDAYNYMKSGQLLRQVINRINGIDFNNLTERQHFGDIYEKVLNDLQSAGNAGEYYTPRAVTSFMVQMIDPKPGETLFDPACGTGGVPDLRLPPYARMLRQAPGGRSQNADRPCARSRRNRCLTCSPSPTCCCTASKTRPSCATTTHWRALTFRGAGPTGSISC